jgi:hypothetical protein
MMGRLVNSGLNPLVPGLHKIQWVPEHLYVTFSSLPGCMQFLPQDKVADFARMTPKDLLMESERAMGDARVHKLHMELMEEGKTLKTFQQVRRCCLALLSLHGSCHISRLSTHHNSIAQFVSSENLTPARDMLRASWRAVHGGTWQQRQGCVDWPAPVSGGMRTSSSAMEMLRNRSRIWRSYSKC